MPATVLCCPIKDNEHPVTMKCLEQYGKESVVIRSLDPDNQFDLHYGMFEALNDHWNGERDLIHIDHDIVFIWDHLRDVSNCAGLWCVCPYYAFGSLVTAPLGFSKFSAELQRKVSLDDVWREMQDCETNDYVIGCEGDWWGVEYHLAGQILDKKIYPCQHMHALNDHSQWGLRPPRADAVMSVDWHMKEGRAKLVDYLRDELGWTLEGEPS